MSDADTTTAPERGSGVSAFPDRSLTLRQPRKDLPVLYRFIVLMIVCAAAVLAFAAASHAAHPETEAAQRAIDYIRTLQNADGGFPFNAGEASDPGVTLDAVFALRAAGVNPATVRKEGHSPADYLKAQGPSYSEDPGAAAKLVLGLVAMKQDPRDFASTDFLAKMNSNFDGATHSYGDDVFDHELYMLARASLDLAPRSGSVDYLKSMQMDDGCWEFGEGWGCDTNTTALAIQALIAAGVSSSDSAVQDALDYLAAAQNEDGGFPYSPVSQWGTDSDANSTALVLQALVAAGENIDEGGPWDTAGASTPLEALLAFQNAETGALTYYGEDSPYATYQAVPALVLKPLPVASMSLEEATPTPEATSTSQPTATATPILNPTATVAVAPQAIPTQALPAALSPRVAEVAGVTMPAAGQGEGVAGGGGLLVGLLAGTGVLAVGSALALRLRRS